MEGECFPPDLRYGKQVSVVDLSDRLWQHLVSINHRGKSQRIAGRVVLHDIGWWGFIDGRLQAHPLVGIHCWVITDTSACGDSLL